MICIPVLKNADEYSLFIALDEDNIERIKSYDPAEVNISKLGPQWERLKLHDVHNRLRDARGDRAPDGGLD